ncbi:MAG: SGNH/GDSL hydrolase family protein [Spirochaetales bacterium]|nr:SGNH/GDSL hydrolase family protein [Spirochaetales bacterium]
MENFSIFGDSVLKGVRSDSSAKKYEVNDNLGLGSVARMAGLSMRNFSKFGCTITKALSYVQKMFTKIDSDIVLMNFGGNDCNFNWEEISRSPFEEHLPNTSLDEFIDTYDRMVDHVLQRRSLPVVSTLLPVQENRYIDYVCKLKGLDHENVRSWVDSRDQSLAAHQKSYSDAVAEMAYRRGIPLIDLRSAFDSHGNCASLIGPDGVHPNAKGQKVMRGCFESFVSDYLAV